MNGLGEVVHFFQPDSRRNTRVLPLFLVILLLALSAPGKVRADETAVTDERAPVHWAFASLFGTGWYNITENRSLFVLRIPPRFELRESGFDENGERRMGIDLRLPLTLGLHNIDDLPGIIRPENFGTIAFTPGIEFEIPVSETFLLRPFAHLGWGTEFQSDYRAWIYHVGIKSRYAFGEDTHSLAIIGNLYRAGYKPNEGPSDTMSGLALGLEGSYPFKRFNLAGRSMALDWHAVYTHFSNRPVFTRTGSQAEVIENTLEIGVALSPRDGEWKFFGWKPDRLGLAYQYDPDGDYSAITFNLTSWIRR